MYNGLQGKNKAMTKLQSMFWSGETLSQRLDSLIAPFDPGRVDCAAYTLCIGPEIYVSPNDQTADSATVTVRKLSDGEAFTIPPGQFAFLLTEEVICVPADALAFISIRAKIKFRGLVNVSGFHVDPGYRGQLTFSVFNAGSVPVHLKRGQPIFLIWYASLDCETALKKNSAIRKGIDPEIVTAVAGELQSFAGLLKKINDIDKSLGDRVHKIEKKQVKFSVIGLIALSVAVALVGNWLMTSISPISSPSPQTPNTAQTAPP